MKRKTTQRKVDWYKQLADYTEKMRPIPYAVGTNDCAHFCVGAVEAMTGQLLSLDAYQYTSESDYKKILANSEHGLPGLVSASLDVPALGPNNARCGDLVYFEPNPGAQSVAICVGNKFCLPGDKGLVFHPLSAAIYSFRIG